LRIDILTIFPEMFEGVLGASMLGRARRNGLIDVNVHNIRDYTTDRHRKTDDYPFGGGAGMVMMAQPVFDCVDAVLDGARARRILLSPRGRTLTQKIAQELAGEERILLLCGHYEGVDERVLEIMDEELSVGDYVLTGGELPAMVVVDCLSRFVPGVLGSSESAADESFSGGRLEYPQYTRPADFRGRKVPDVLLNGNHAQIEEWRCLHALQKTARVRPDLLSADDADRAEVPEDVWL